ncbi:hypothetical protein C3B51_15280 [Pseudoalteromonas rubra]|uniref:Uncharacterized protein n=1 Tax=Pseudoalteromonas rubra TaxID=43658 RepID=A0A4Q7E6P3_9GAMM|nr:hypothetical protein [Pseudoalteromonas rubra]RZM78251.1 hypothetical protein C3B51_15280 [Pseudoalteromonas rubra]
MKLKIQKTKLKNLSKNKNTLDAKRTAQVAGGGWFEPETDNCQSHPYFCKSARHCSALGCDSHNCNVTRQGGSMC